MKKLFVYMLALMVFWPMAVSAAFAQDTRKELKERFQERHQQLSRLKEQGKVGETWQGYVEPLDEALVNAQQREFIEVENADRRKLYDLIANEVAPDERKIPPAIVAQRNARRNFKNAGPQECLKIEEGRWIQKRDEARTERIARLKRDGKVGETWQGLLGIVHSSDESDAQISEIVAQENRARKELYERIAKAQPRETSADEIAQRFAKDILQAAAPSTFTKPRNGGWERKPPARD